MPGSCVFVCVHVHVCGFRDCHCWWPWPGSWLAKATRSHGVGARFTLRVKAALGRGWATGRSRSRQFPVTGFQARVCQSEGHRPLSQDVTSAGVGVSQDLLHSVGAWWSAGRQLLRPSAPPPPHPCPVRSELGEPAVSLCSQDTLEHLSQATGTIWWLGLPEIENPGLPVKRGLQKKRTSRWSVWRFLFVLSSRAGATGWVNRIHARLSGSPHRPHSCSCGDSAQAL